MSLWWRQHTIPAAAMAITATTVPVAPPITSDFDLCLELLMGSLSIGRGVSTVTNGAAQGSVPS